jgi:Spy/CpxP family protein refolding chaperone
MKMTRRRTTVVGILVGLSLLIAGSILYAHGENSWGSGFGNPEERVLMVSLYLTKKLDMDTTQQQALETITNELLKKGKALHDLRTSSRDELVSILRADSVDMQRVQLLQSQHQAIIADFIAEAGSRLADFVNMLSPEQRQRLAVLIENHPTSCPLR